MNKLLMLSTIDINIIMLRAKCRGRTNKKAACVRPAHSKALTRADEHKPASSFCCMVSGGYQLLNRRGPRRQGQTHEQSLQAHSLTAVRGQTPASLHQRCDLAMHQQCDLAIARAQHVGTPPLDPQRNRIGALAMSCRHALRRATRRL